MARALLGGRFGWGAAPPSGLGPGPGASRALPVLIVLILAQLVVSQSLNLFPRMIAIDFYQYWAVGAAHRLTDQPLGGPYTDHRSYTAVVRDYAARSNQPRLTWNGRVLGPTGFTATPFLYLLFAAFPADYSRALALFHVLQLLLFLAALVLLGVLYRYEMFPLLCLALLLVLGSGPLSADLRLGNVGCVQLAALAALLYLASRQRHAPEAPALGAAVLAGLTLLTLAKPNVALVAAVMGAHFWLVHGTRFFAIAAIPAALSAAAAVIASCVYFRSWTIWAEWYERVFGGNPYTLARPSPGGNYATALLLSRWLGIDVWAVSAIIALALGVSLIGVIAWSLSAGPPSRAIGRRALERVFGDAQVAMAIAVTLTIALPPLVWYHYYLIALVPGLWLLNASAGSRYEPLCGLVALALSSGLLNVLFLPLGWADAAGAGAALSWVPLWSGILLRLYSTGAHEPVSAPSPAAKPDQRPIEGAQPSRHARRSRRASRAS